MADGLVLAANKLSRAAPATWDEFIQSFAQYVATVKDECVQSPLETLPVAQGRAQQAARIYEMLSTCRACADRMVARRAK